MEFEPHEEIVFGAHEKRKAGRPAGLTNRQRELARQIVTGKQTRFLHAAQIPL